LQKSEKIYKNQENPPQNLKNPKIFFEDSNLHKSEKSKKNPKNPKIFLKI